MKKKNQKNDGLKSYERYKNRSLFILWAVLAIVIFFMFHSGFNWKYPEMSDFLNYLFSAFIGIFLSAGFTVFIFRLMFKVDN